MQWITVMLPVVTVVFAALLTSSYFAIDSYNWWYMGMYPGYMAVMCGMIGSKDRKEKNYSMWTLPCKPEKIWDAKMITGSILSGISVLSVLILTILIGYIMKVTMQAEYIAVPTLTRQISAGILMWVTTLWQIPFCIILTREMGTFLAMLLHVGSYSMIATAVSLKSYYALLPGAITARVLCPVLGILPNGLLLQPASFGYQAELEGMHNLLIGIPASIIWFVLFWAVGRKWFGKQVED